MEERGFMMLRRQALVFLTAVIVVGLAATGGSFALPADEKPRFDVTDISYLWPAPSTQADVDALISTDTADPATNVALWDEAAFNRMLEIVTSDEAEIKHPGGASRRIALLPAFRNRKNWKVVAFRADPSAPGGHPSIVDKFGSTPQLRLIVQPVTVEAGKVKVHDFTAHLVYSYAAPKEAAKPGFLTAANQDEAKFRAILDDLGALKVMLKAKGIDTQGVPLGVHPGLRDSAGGAGFAAAVRALLTRHVNVKNLFAMAFMGLPDASPEPWIFVAASNSGDGTFAAGQVPAIGFKPAQMFDRKDGDPLVVPVPVPTNRNPITNFLLTPIGDRRGVATSALFDPNVKLNSTAQVNASGDPILDSDGLTNSEIADLIANPEKSHFFSNDCFSCHSESTRRAILKLPASATFAYKLPNGVSGVEPAVVPTSIWNVRNFGWFPAGNGVISPTVSHRTANETADCVQFINRVYFGNP
jgi:hypothetical protein